MGTRAAIRFKDENGSYSVYQHWDGDPETIAENIEKAQEFAWVLPRFEAEEFAAAYVRANKSGAGDICLTKGVAFHGDLQHAYEVTCEDGKLACRQISID